MTIEKRVIKKYPNRRLYDTTESKYITLDDVKKLVLEGVPFLVTDKQTGEDITRNILLQIIIEQEEAGSPVFSTDMLQQLIGFYGKSMQGAASNFIQQSLAMLAEQQQAFQQQMTRAVTGNPLAAMQEMTERNMELWRRMQNEFFKATGMGKKPGSPADETQQEPDDAEQSEK
ncbi:MAG: polyhydroxyalkanoate synthesis repressor PhaR [Gammaproteobacteria bacterium]